MIKKVQQILFHRYPFGATFLICMLLSLPWWIAFWPGTLQYDSCGQLLQYVGVGKMTGHHPYPVTMAMGLLLDAGRLVFSSDNMGIFLYTMLQFLAQSCVIAYVFCVYEHMGAPLWVRWCSLAFFTLFPLIPNWGISYVKDTGYYISFLLLIAVMADFLLNDLKVQSLSRGQYFLWLVALLGVITFRNDGRYIAVTAILCILIQRKGARKLCFLGAGFVLGILVLIEGIYMPLRDIPKGSVREVLSVPLMQTAVYIREYPQDLTAEEIETLLKVFEVEDLEQVADAYDRNISDNVKALFLEYPNRKELFLYLKTWWQQFLKQPGSYFQTYFEHCSGYFLISEKCYNDVMGWFKILDGQCRSDEYLDIYFAQENSAFRNWMEHFTYAIYEFPLIGLLFRPAFYTWLLLCTFASALYQRKWSSLSLFVPALVVLCICTISPLNASVRYFLPVMVTMPLYIGICTSHSYCIPRNHVL